MNALPKESLVTRKELLILVSITVFAVIWTALIVPYLSASSWYQSQLPPVQFFLFEAGFLIGFITVIGVPISYLVVKRKRTGKVSLATEALKYGMSAWLGISIIYDMWEPPYFVSTSGALLLDNPHAMTGTAIDATVAWCWQQLGVNGPALYYATYIVFPVVLLICLSLAFTWKRFLKLLSGR